MPDIVVVDLPDRLGASIFGSSPLIASNPDVEIDKYTISMLLKRSENELTKRMRGMHFADSKLWASVFAERRGHV